MLSREDISALASSFKVYEFERNQPGLVPIEMNIRLKDGRDFHRRISEAKGSRQNPLNREELLDKFNDCLDNAAKRYTLEDRKRIVTGIDHILEFDDMNELIHLF